MPSSPSAASRARPTKSHCESWRTWEPGLKSRDRAFSSDDHTWRVACPSWGVMHQTVTRGHRDIPGPGVQFLATGISKSRGDSAMWLKRAIWSNCAIECEVQMREDVAVYGTVGPYRSEVHTS